MAEGGVREEGEAVAGGGGVGVGGWVGHFWGGLRLGFVGWVG